MELLGASVVAWVVAAARGGDVAAPARHHWRRPTLALLAFACQLAADWPDANASQAARAWAGTLHVVSYGLLGAFLWTNRKTPWLWLFGLGALANAIVIAANAGFMPAVPHPALGIRADAMASGFVVGHAVIMGPEARLAWLGDILHTPGWLPIRRTVSAGDLVMASGLFVMLQALMLRGRRPWGSPATTDCSP